MAMPILPVDLLPTKRTGSIGSSVPPAVITMWRPAKSTREGLAGAAGEGMGAEAPGSGEAGSGSAIAGTGAAGSSAAAGAAVTATGDGLASSASTTASTIRSSAASRPRPTIPEASGPISGSTIR